MTGRCVGISFGKIVMETTPSLQNFGAKENRRARKRRQHMWMRSGVQALFTPLAPRLRRDAATK